MAEVKTISVFGWSRVIGTESGVEYLTGKVV